MSPFKITRFIILTLIISISSQFSFAKSRNILDHNFYFLIDKDSHEILLEKNSHTRIAPSSMTKLMTAYVVFDEIKKGNIKLNSQCVIGKDAWRKRGSSMFLNYGDIVSIDKLLKGLLTVSGNDSSIALAQATGRGYSNFISLMNIKARELGMNNSKFQNPHGLNQDRHYMSLYDLATLLSSLYSDFPEFVPYLGIKKFTYGNITQYNRNPLLRTKYKGFIGGKTGHTNDGGYGIAASVTRGNRTLIGVVNKARTSRQRTKFIRQLFDYGFKKYNKIELFKKHQDIALIPTWIGEKDMVSVAPNKNISLNIPKKYNVDDVKVSIEYDGPVQTPIFDGKKIANLRIQIKDQEPIRYSLFATEDVKKAKFFTLISKKVIYQSKRFIAKIERRVEKYAIFDKFFTKNS